MDWTFRETLEIFSGSLWTFDGFFYLILKHSRNGEINLGNPKKKQKKNADEADRTTTKRRTKKKKRKKWKKEESPNKFQESQREKNGRPVSVLVQ